MNNYIRSPTTLLFLGFLILIHNIVCFVFDFIADFFRLFFLIVASCRSFSHSLFILFEQIQPSSIEYFLSDACHTHNRSMNCIQLTLVLEIKMRFSQQINEENITFNYGILLCSDQERIE